MHKSFKLICLLLSTVPTVSIGSEYTSFDAHYNAVQYHENVVEQVELYMRHNAFKREPLLYFINSCKWLNKNTNYNYCNTSDARITRRIMRNHGMKTN